MSQFYTYLHCKPNGDPFYVGKGTGNRSRNFINGRNRHHKNIVAKHGVDNIQVFIFECDSEQQAFDDEIQQIAQLRREGYELVNQTNGGEGMSGNIPSEETREKLRGNKSRTGMKDSLERLAQKSSHMKGNNFALGFKHSTETRKKVSEGLKGNKNSIGVVPSIETRRKLAIASTGRTHVVSDGARKKLSESAKGNKRWLGRKHTEESRIKISLAKTGKKMPPRTAEHRAKLSAANKGRACSEKCRLAVAAANRRRKRDTRSN